MPCQIFTVNSTLLFGKYKGWTVDQVLDENPGYIEWCLEQRIFTLDEDADDALMTALERHRKERK